MAQTSARSLGSLGAVSGCCCCGWGAGAEGPRRTLPNWPGRPRLPCLLLFSAPSARGARALAWAAHKPLCLPLISPNQRPPLEGAVEPRAHTGGGPAVPQVQATGALPWRAGPEPQLGVTRLSLSLGTEPRGRQHDDDPLLCSPEAGTSLGIMEHRGLSATLVARPGQCLVGHSRVSASPGTLGHRALRGSSCFLRSLGRAPASWTSLRLCPEREWVALPQDVRLTFSLSLEASSSWCESLLAPLWCGHSFNPRGDPTWVGGAPASSGPRLGSCPPGGAPPRGLWPCRVLGLWAVAGGRAGRV